MDEITRRARELRSTLTEAEHRLWKELRKRSLGAKFRRQVPIGNYGADFACLPKRLIVEVDGGHHVDNAQLSASSLIEKVIAMVEKRTRDD
ncbi:MAG TPA: DUF559 domain-containing protein [Thermoanaerobaculia bacterium]|nr:DUF559 domain-containing protein [Thermoanaerobaculia bacterium]